MPFIKIIENSSTIIKRPLMIKEVCDLVYNFPDYKALVSINL